MRAFLRFFSLNNGFSIYRNRCSVPISRRNGALLSKSTNSNRRLKYAIITFFTIPSRNTMAPPDLARNAPVFDVSHPVEIGVLPTLRIKLNLPLFDNLYGWFCKWHGLNKPLGRKAWFYYSFTPVAFSNRMAVIFRFDQEALFLKHFDNYTASLFCRFPCYLLSHIWLNIRNFWNNLSFFIQNTD